MTRNNPVIIKVDFFGDEALHKFCEHVHAPPIMKKRYLCSNMSIKPVLNIIIVSMTQNVYLNFVLDIYFLLLEHIYESR